MANRELPKADFFISRAGENAETAVAIAGILNRAGHSTFIQDQDFGNTNFMAKMADAFAMVDGGARVIAVLSPHYLKKEYCLAEAHYPLTGDPHNRKERLIVLRVAPCVPDGHLRGIPYVDLVPLLLDAESFARAVRNAAAPREKGEIATTSGAQILHPEIRPVPGFTGREAELEAIEAALWSKGGRAALTATQAAVKGLGGVGKSVLAQEYAWRNRGRYHGVWWIRAEKAETLLDDLIALGARFIPGLKEVPDRTQAAHATLAAISQMRPEKPWLLIYDNVEQPGDLDKLTPVDGAQVLITTRWQARVPGVQPIPVDVFPPDMAIEYLLEGTPGADRQEAAALARELGYLPLALAHARAYCAEAAMTLKDYRAGLAELIKLAPFDSAYPSAVFATFDRAITKAAERVPEAETLMGIFAFLASDNIPLDLVPDTLMNAVLRSRAIAALAALSLLTPVTLDDSSTGVSVHRLVQEVMKGRLGKRESELGALATRLVADAYPAGDVGPGDVRSWPTCRRLESHVIAVLAVAPDEGDAASNTARLLNQYGLHLHARADFAAAEPLMRRALAIDEKSFGPEHPKVAIRLNNLASLLQATNRPAEAEPLMRRALAIDETSFGPEHPDVAIDLNNLAALLKATNGLAAAEPLMRRVISIFEMSLGAEHPNVATSLNNLAQLLQDANRLAEAEPLMRRALAIDETSFGPEHPDVARDLNNLARLLQDTNRLAEAEPLMRRALAIWEASLGADHPNTRTGRENLRLLLAMNAGHGGGGVAVSKPELAPVPRQAKPGFFRRLFS